MKKPLNCSQELYNIMVKCWAYEHEDRPTFRELTKILLDGLKRLGKKEEMLEKFKANSFYFS
jgi:hypothetical protein